MIYNGLLFNRLCYLSFSLNRKSPIVYSLLVSPVRKRFCSKTRKHMAMTHHTYTVYVTQIKGLGRGRQNNHDRIFQTQHIADADEATSPIRQRRGKYASELVFPPLPLLADVIMRIRTSLVFVPSRSLWVSSGADLLVLACF